MNGHDLMPDGYETASTLGAVEMALVALDFPGVTGGVQATITGLARSVPATT